MEANVKGMFGYRPKVHVIRYADDFVVVAETEEILERQVKPAIQNFMAERGLRLSEAKTVITHIQDGFDFFSGQDVAQVRYAVNCATVQSCGKIGPGETGHTAKTVPQVAYDVLLRQLNRLLRGWGNYHRFGNSSRVSGKVDYYPLQGIWRWIERQHKGKRLRKHLAKYFAKVFWTHSAWTTDKKGPQRLIERVRLSALGLRRHIKIRGKATPYDPEQADYFRLLRELGTSRPV